MNSLTIQYIVVAILVIAAIIYFSKTMRASFAGKKSCGKGCGCDSNPKPFEQKKG